MTWSYPTSVIHTASRKDIRLAVGDDVAVSWKRDGPNAREYEHLRIDGFVQLVADTDVILLLFPIWYEFQRVHSKLDLPRVRKYAGRSEPIPVALLVEQVLVHHYCAGGCPVREVCHVHRRRVCTECTPRGPSARGLHVCHDEREYYFILDKRDGFIRDSQDLNDDWLDKV